MTASEGFQTVPRTSTLDRMAATTPFSRVAAWGAVLRQRAPKILRQMAQRDPREASQECLQNWIGQQEGVRKRHAMSVPAMITLLSNRGDRAGKAE